VKFQDEKMLIHVSDGMDMESVTIQFEKRNASEYVVWKNALKENVASFVKIKELEMIAVQKELEEAEISGEVFNSFL
jgi:hypothetical protein